MDSYLTLRLLHILSAVVVTGTGAGIAFFMLMVSRTRNIEAIVVTSRFVVLADWLFTAPAVCLQFITGVLLMTKLGYSFNSLWFLTTLGLFLFIGICWIPVIVIQYKLKALAEQSRESGVLLSEFSKWMKRWVLLGIPAFVAILVIFYLMVFKPLPLT